MSNLSLERLLFDPADAASGPLIGSYIMGGTSDAPITDTVAGSLDVNVTNAINVDLDGIYNVSTNATPDNVGLIGNTRAASPGASGQIERITVAVLGDAVVNNDVHALDVSSFLMGYNGTTWDRLTATAGKLDVTFSNSTIAVTATALDIRALAYGTDSVTAYQGSTWTVATDVLPNILPLSQAISVVDTAGGTALPAAPLANRKRLQIQNLGADPIYLGKTGVTTASGLMIAKGATESLEAGPSAVYYAISASGKTVPCRILEF